MIEITVPKLNNNDAHYDLVEWLVEDGATVAKDDDLATVETSKAAEDLVCEHDGVLLRAVQAGEQVAPGSVVGRLFADEAERTAYLASAAAAPAATAGPGDDAAYVLTDAARTLAAASDVGTDELRALGKRVIKGSDVEALLARRAPAAQEDTDRVPLSQLQRAIGSVVTESLRTIPTSFTVLRVRVDAAEDSARELARHTDVAISLPELLISELARLRGDFPAFFATYHDDGTIAHADGSHIGVTVDLGQGLYIPVVRDADELSVADVAERLEDIRFSALRGSFKGSELTGATITLSLNNDADVVFTQPIVFPGQTCMVSLGGTQSVLELTDEGEVVATRRAHIGLAFDHRVINGRDAVLFLQALKSALEQPVAVPVEAGEVG
ncbi:2-oxo acid dehydrogenase subunit E2 [Streptomyces sp. BR1]|uniref:2-oxo acid dehydrogenase subunit E2 n=1 Tax=Streptomyces sp. BR1 TaxID=1592323 RepID=UPI00402B8D08